jgi:ketosteroid isomerase-like protein
MDIVTFNIWLESYGRAWMQRDAQAAAELYTENATYQVTPFSDPLQGRPAILDYWTHVAETERDIQFTYEILAITQEAGIARWRASFQIVPQDLSTQLDGIFWITLDNSGRCTSLKEWWHKQQS